jgi:alpha-L-fucosidase
METYYHSIGHNATLLLNFPIMPNGLIHPSDEEAALGMAKAIKETFAINLVEGAKAEASNIRGNAAEFAAGKAIDTDKDTYWATDDEVSTASLTIDFGKPTRFNRFLAQEYIRLGQRVKSFTIEALVDGNWKKTATGTTIGYKRIVRFPSVEATKLRFTITGSKNCPVISNIGIYNAPVFLKAPSIQRNQAGDISISTVDVGPIFYYTLDGSEPTLGSSKYTGPFPTDGKVSVRAISHDPASGKSSPVGFEAFDICRKSWRIPDIDDAKVAAVLDGDPSTVWHQGDHKPMPVDLVIDLGSEQTLSGFRYLPDQNRWSSGLIANYQFDVSTDKARWKTASQGEFSNIKNNPVWQVKKFEPTEARYIRLRTLKNSDGNSRTGYAEVDVITN